jgi:outer membrane lipoprotein SlyB
MRSTFTSLVALISLIPFVSLPAQTDQRVPLGKRVRITMPDTMSAVERPVGGRPLVVIGNLVAMSDSAMSIRNDVTSGYVTVPLSRVQRLEVSTGSDRTTSAVVGGLIGLGIGGVAGYSSGDDCPNGDWLCFPREDTAVIGAVLGAAVGTLIGVLGGRGERWKDASVRRVTAIPIGTRSIAFTSTLRF